MNRDTTNALKEFIGIVDFANSTVKCAVVNYKSAAINYSGKQEKTCLLKVGYTEQEFEEFKTSLDFMYDSGFGGQEIEGTIWFEDGTWCTRGEYDGSEWWEHHCLPDIPDELKK